MSDILEQWKARHEELLATETLTEDDLNSPLSDKLISEGKQAVEDLVSKQDEPVQPSLAEQWGARHAELLDSEKSRSSMTPLERIQNAEVTPEALDRIKAADQIAEDEMTIATAGGVGAGLATKAVEGIPFVGSWVDEGFDKLDPGRGGKLRNIQEAMDRQHPGKSQAAEIGGGVTGGLALAGGAIPAAQKVLTAGSNLMKATLAAMAGGTTGAIEGATYGYGMQEGQGRLQNAKTNAAWGAGLGGAFAFGGTLAGEGVQAFLKRIKKTDVSIIQQEFGLSKPAAKAVKVALEGEDLDAAVKLLSNLDDEAMLADAGPAAASMLDAVAQTGGAALRTTRDAVEGRMNRLSPKMRTAFDLAFGKPQGTRETMSEIAALSATTRGSAYDFAFRTPIDYASGQGRAIEEVLERIPPNTLQMAIAEANEQMIAEGVKNLQIMAEVSEDGSVAFREMPNVRQLDEIKKALQSIAQNETDAVTGKASAKGKRAEKLAMSLRDATTEAVPAYKRALKLGGDKIAEEKAFLMGQDLFKKNVTLEDIVKLMDDANPQTRKAAKQGVRNFLDQVMEETKLTITDTNLESRQALSVIRLLSSSQNRKKLEAMVGPENARRVLEVVDQNGAALELKAMVATNSRTASRQSLQGGVDEIAAPNALQRLGRGEFALSTKQVIKALTGATDEVTADSKRALYNEIAEALTVQRGEKAERAMRLVQQAMDGQPLKNEEALFVSQFVTPAAIAGERASVQTLAR